MIPCGLLHTGTLWNANIRQIEMPVLILIAGMYYWCPSTDYNNTELKMPILTYCSLLQNNESAFIVCGLNGVYYIKVDSH